MRFYLRYTGASCTILDRASHNLIGFLDIAKKEEAINTLTRLSSMTIEEYIEYCLSLGLKFKYDNTNCFEFSQDNEEWCTKAWIYTTKNALKDLNLKEDIIPEDIATVALVKDIKSHKPIKTNKAIDEVASTREEANKSILEDANKKLEKLNKKDKVVNTIDKPKKLVKKPLSATNTIEPTETIKANTEENKSIKSLPKKKLVKKDNNPKYTKDILRSLLASKKIDVKTYREEMKKLA